MSKCDPSAECVKLWSATPPLPGRIVDVWPDGFGSPFSGHGPALERACVLSGDKPRLRMGNMDYTLSHDAYWCASK